MIKSKLTQGGGECIAHIVTGCRRLQQKHSKVAARSGGIGGGQNVMFILHI